MYSPACDHVANTGLFACILLPTPMARAPQGDLGFHGGGAPWPGSSAGPPLQVGPSAFVQGPSGFNFPGVSSGPVDSLGPAGRIAPLAPTRTADWGTTQEADGGRVMCTAQICAQRSPEDASIIATKGQLLFVTGGEDEIVRPKRVHTVRTLTALNAALFHDGQQFWYDIMAGSGYEEASERAQYHKVYVTDNGSMIMRPDEVRSMWRMAGVCMGVQAADELEQGKTASTNISYVPGGWTNCFNYWSSADASAQWYLALVLVTIIPNENGEYSNGQFIVNSDAALTGSPVIVTTDDARKHGGDGTGFPPSKRIKGVDFGAGTANPRAFGVKCWQYVPISTLSKAGPSREMLRGTEEVDTASKLSYASSSTGYTHSSTIKWWGAKIFVGSTAAFADLDLVRNMESRNSQLMAARDLTFPFNGATVRDSVERAYSSLSKVGTATAFIRCG